MGEGTDRVSEIENEIEELREEMVPIVSELDRRRHALLDWRAQAKAHLVPIAIGAAVFAAGATWLVWSAIESRRVRKLPLEKLRRLRLATKRMIASPERVAAADPSGMRTLALAAARAAATAAAGSLAKQTVETLVAQSRTRAAAPHPAVVNP